MPIWIVVVTLLIAGCTEGRTDEDRDRFVRQLENERRIQEAILIRAYANCQAIAMEHQNALLTRKCLEAYDQQVEMSRQDVELSDQMLRQYRQEELRRKKPGP
jgi:hypothetical protein